jgi:hypothetical protein
LRELEDEPRARLLQMAAVWDQLAIERAELIARRPELALPEEGAEEAVRSGEG